MLRTIMIFPQFKNIGIIDEIRDRFDPLAKLVRPHITLVFPFDSEMSNEELGEKLTSSLQKVGSFELTLYGFSKSADNYLFLDIEKGKEIIKAIHDELYSEHFKEFYLDIPYIPHMTVGKLCSEQELNDAYEYVKNIDARFETVVDKVSVEMLGEHEESLIAIEKMLDDAISMAKETFGLDNPYSQEDNDLILIEPSAETKEDALEYKNEHFTAGDMEVHGSGGLAFYDDYDEWLRHIDAIRVSTPERPIQTSTFFSKRISDGKLIGCIKIHHSLTDDLKRGGNIAYGIRPSERGKGYGKKQLKLALAYAKQLHIDQVIIACDKANIASAATAKSCKGILVNEFEEDGMIKQHYSIEL